MVQPPPVKSSPLASSPQRHTRVLERWWPVCMLAHGCTQTCTMRTLVTGDSTPVQQDSDHALRPGQGVCPP